MNGDRPVAGGQVCSRCGKGFQCGMAAGLARCWCAELPAIPPPLGEGSGCLCPDCLRAAVEGKQAEH